MVNLNCEKVNTGAFKNFVQLWVGICELNLVDLNDFLQSPNLGVVNIIGMECLFLSNCLRIRFYSFLEKNTFYLSTKL